MLMQVVAAAVVGRRRRGVPAWRTARVRIVDGLRRRVAMTIPFSYIVRNVAARRLTTALTRRRMALVVYVFATVLMLAAGSSTRWSRRDRTTTSW
jgi:hypothetical protein